MHSNTTVAALEFDVDTAQLNCSGQWTIHRIDQIEKSLSQLWPTLPAQLTLNREEIVELDTAGAILLVDIENKLAEQGKQISKRPLSAKCEPLYHLVASQDDFATATVKPSASNWLAQVGQWVVHKVNESLAFISFVGHFMTTLIESLRSPKQINWRSILVIIDETGYQALPIVALLIFLVGIVLTYQIAIQLSTYGANIYIVDLTGMITFREFGPLITAIIAAGRTSTSFTAQIGTMKVNEEIDALKTMGISTYIRLVLPKIIGLMIALPLLAVWADVFGVMGAMMMSKLKLGIGYSSYLNRFEHTVLVKHFVIGMVKVPVFAILIALVGSYQGLQVERTADSVGEKTTKSAVQSIFLIIIADAVFSVIFSLRGI